MPGSMLDIRIKKFMWPSPQQGSYVEGETMKSIIIIQCKYYQRDLCQVPLNT